MTMIGPFLIGAPGALLLLLALPALWWVLKATPPPPAQAELPSLRLLDDIAPPEETPARTPWWIWLIRTAAVLAAVLGLSQPVYAPGRASETASGGPVLLVIDNGWAAAPRWNESINAAISYLDSQGGSGSIHLLLTTPGPGASDPAEGLLRSEMARRLSGLAPLPWNSDRQAALDLLTASGLEPSHIFYASDGIENDKGAAFASALAARAPLTIFSAAPRGAVAITSLSAEATGVSLGLVRLASQEGAEVALSAFTDNGLALGSAKARFGPGETGAQAVFTLPPAALARVTGFRVTGQAGAGTVWLWDSQDRTRQVGLVETGAAAQPLLSDIHYIRRAIEPFASVSTGNLETLLAASPDAIILSDTGSIPEADADRLARWLEAGGALIRFAGPRLAAQGDDFLPVSLRRASRAIGGALAWEQPQALAPFAEGSPFAGLDVPGDILVRQQVLASPEPLLSEKTWARLDDGSPLVTAEKRGLGTLILFHVTAGPDWSDLPYSGLFGQMLRRVIAAGRGEAVIEPDATYLPQTALDGFGRLTPAPPGAAPLRTSDFAGLELSQTHPPGLYRGPAGSRALNTGAGAAPMPVTAWPLTARLLTPGQAGSARLAGVLLVLAGALLTIDILAALLMAGRISLPAPGRRTGGLAGLALALALLIPSNGQARAQSAYGLQPDGSYRTLSTSRADVVPLPGQAGSTRQAEAALTMRFGFVETGDVALDQRTRAGLRGLSMILNTRTSVEPGEPHGLDLERDALELYPLIYFNVPDTAAPLSATAVRRLNLYLRSGGALVIDTRAGVDAGQQGDVSRLERLLAGLDAPALQPVPDNHVLSRSFYLIKDFPGRYAGRTLWIEQAAGPAEARGDSVSRLFVGDADWASAWATDEYGRDLYSVDGGFRQRETARRFGVNLVMYVLTGSYKDDQVHVPALLERLGERGGPDRPAGEPGSDPGGNSD